MWGWALTIALAMGMAGTSGPASAQTRWKQPNDLFSVALPAGWSINEPEENRWIIRPMDARAASTREAPAACTLQLTESPSTMFSSQADLDRMMQSPAFLRMWQQSMTDLVAESEVELGRVMEVHGLRFVHMVALGRIRDPRTRRPAQRGAVMLAMTLAPGQFWRFACGMPAGETEPPVATVNAMIRTLRIHDTSGATNAR